MREREEAGPESACRSWIPAAVLAGFLVLYLAKGLADPTIHHPDFWAQVQLGDALGSKPASELASPWTPIGYPFLLRAAQLFGARPVIAAHLISIVFALLALWATFRIGENVTRDRGLALLTAICTGLSGPFLQWATAEGSDMPFVAMMLVSAAFATEAKPRLFAAGLAAGLAYDFRYAAAAPIAAQLLLVACFGTPAGDRRARGRRVLELLGGALAGASPQLLLTLWVYGTPVRTFMVKNVWMGIYGENNWQNKWGLVPDDIGLADVIRLDPARFITHWLENLASLAIGAVVFPERLMGHVVSWVLPFGAIKIAWRLKQPAVRFWYGVTGVYTAALCFAFLGSRYALPIVPALELAVCWFLWELLPERKEVAGRPVRVRMLGAMLFLAVKLPLDLVPGLRYAPMVETILAVDGALRKAGMTRSQEVLSTAVDYYDVETTGRYARWETEMPEPVTDMHGLVAMMRRRGYRFVVYDREYGKGKVLPKMAFLLEPEKLQAGELERLLGPCGPDDAVVYRLRSAAGR